MSLHILDIIKNSIESTKLMVYVHAFRCCWSLRAESDDDMGFGLFD